MDRKRDRRHVPAAERLHHFTTDSNADEFSDLGRAVGARRCDIRNQFLLESALLAGFGGLIGVGIGTGAAWTVAALGYWDAVVSWPSAAIGFLFSVSLGIFFGLYPATRAAALEPIEALVPSSSRSDGVLSASVCELGGVGTRVNLPSLAIPLCFLVFARCICSV